MVFIAVQEGIQEREGRDNGSGQDTECERQEGSDRVQVQEGRFQELRNNELLPVP